LKLFRTCRPWTDMTVVYIWGMRVLFLDRPRGPPPHAPCRLRFAQVPLRRLGECAWLLGLRLHLRGACHAQARRLARREGHDPTIAVLFFPRMIVTFAQVGPDFKRYMDKRLAIKLNGNRHITGTICPPASAVCKMPPARTLIRLLVHLAGTLRGFDQFMNLVLDETEEQVCSSPEFVLHTRAYANPDISLAVLHNRSAPGGVSCAISGVSERNKRPRDGSHSRQLGGHS
jgi:small nuclear ribonucleoprotein (snRNP)-like protein